jgi:uncharacterized phage infection (PIP) family protein YhgE
MSEEKFKDLVLNYTPAMRGLKGSVSLKVEYSGATYNLDGEHSVRIPLASSAKAQTLNLQLYEGDRVYGAGSASIDSLIDKQASISLGQGVAVLSGKLEDRLMPKRRKNSTELKCPYLEKLSDGQQADSDVLEQIMLQRTGKCEGGLTASVKVSLEPDSPTKSTVTELPDLESLNYAHLENMNPSQLKKLIVVLSENVTQYLSKAQMLNSWRQELYNKTQDRLEMQQDMNRKTENLRTNALGNVQKLQNIQELRNDRINKLRELQCKHTQLTQELDELRSREVCLKRENLELKARQIRHADLQNIVDESIHLTHEFEQSSNSILQQAEQNNAQAEQEVAALQLEISELKTKLELTQASEKQILGDNNNLRDKIRNVKMELAEKADIVKRIQDAEKTGELHAQGRRQAQDELGALIAEIQSNLDPLKASIQDLVSKKKDQSDQVISLQATVAEKDNKLQGKI